LADASLAHTSLRAAADQVARTLAGAARAPVIRAFFDEPTNTVSYVVHCPATRRAAVIDSVLDYDPAAGRTRTASADAMVDYIKSESLTVDWLLETHVHADHLSAAPYLQGRLGGALAIGLPLEMVEFWPRYLREVTRDQVAEAARAVLGQAPSTTGWLLPGDAAPRRSPA